MQTRPADRPISTCARRAQAQAARARPLGQSRRPCRARLCRPSLWDWQKLPDYSDPRYTDYARANASIGINGAVLNNVNANADILTPDISRKVAALADVFRPYGIKVYLSARFSAPIEIGGLKTADPLDPRGRRLVEGQGRRDLSRDPRFRRLPGQGQFRRPAGPAGLRPHPCRRRQHAGRCARAAWRRRDVARLRLCRQDNARATAPSRPITSSSRSTASSATMCWCRSRTARSTSSRASRSTRCSARCRKTPLMLEFQITKEYLGFATHLVYLGTLWEEVLQRRHLRARARDRPSPR